jgi:hypothetical protein
VLAEDRATDVLERLRRARVDHQELLVGVGLGLLRDQVGELEADQHDDVGPGFHRGLHVLLLRGGVGGLVNLLRPVVRLGRGLHPVDRELQELVLPDGVGSDQSEGLAAALAPSEELSLAAALQAVARSAVPAARAANRRGRRLLWDTGDMGMTFRWVRRGTPGRQREEGGAVRGVELGANGGS